MTPAEQADRDWYARQNAPALLAECAARGARQSRELRRLYKVVASLRAELRRRRAVVDAALAAGVVHTLDEGYPDSFGCTPDCPGCRFRRLTDTPRKGPDGQHRTDPGGP